MSNGTLNRVAPVLQLPDRAALAALDVAAIDNATVETRQPPAIWRLSKNFYFNTTPDPARYQVAYDPNNAGDNGYWIRDLEAGEPAGASRPDQYVNSASVIASDDNYSGQDDFVLSTMMEAVYRIGKQPVDGYDIYLTQVNGSGIIYVYIASDVSGSSFTIDLKMINDGTVAFIGAKTVISTHTITSVTPYNTTTGVVGSYTLSGAPVLTPNLGKFVRINAGPRLGWKASISKTPGAGVFQGTWSDQGSNGAAVEPQVGDAVEIYSIPQIRGDMRINCGPSGTNGGTIIFQDLEMGVPGSDHSVIVSGGQVYFIGCQLYGLDFYEGVSYGLVNTCHVTECRSYGFVECAGSTFATGGGANLAARGRGIVHVSSRCLMQDGGMTAGHPTEGPGHIRCDANIAVANYITPGVIVYPGSSVTLSEVATIYQSNGSPLAVQVFSGGQMFYATGKAPVITGTAPTGDYKVGGTAKAEAAIPYLEALNGAVVAINQ